MSERRELYRSPNGDRGSSGAMAGRCHRRFGSEYRSLNALDLTRLTVAGLRIL
jgi:hypothetical protein